MERAQGDELCVVVSNRILGIELRRLKRQGFELTRLQADAAWERASCLTSVKRGLPFVGLHETGRRGVIK